MSPIQAGDITAAEVKSARAASSYQMAGSYPRWRWRGLIGAGAGIVLGESAGAGASAFEAAS